MSYPPSPQLPGGQPGYLPYPQQTVIIQQAPSNGLGTAGFMVSLIGLLMCGCLCPIGAIMSLMALGKEPRGLAIAGLIIGIFGSLLLLILIPLFLLPFFAAIAAGPQ